MIIESFSGYSFHDAMKLTDFFSVLPTLPHPTPSLGACFFPFSVVPGIQDPLWELGKCSPREPQLQLGQLTLSGRLQGDALLETLLFPSIPCPCPHPQNPLLRFSWVSLPGDLQRPLGQTAHSVVLKPVSFGNTCPCCVTLVHFPLWVSAFFSFK